MKILHRYVVREHVGPLLFSLSALTALLLLNYIAKQFANLVGKGLPWSVIAEFFLLAIPFTVAMTLPMAVLVATIYAFSRLASENEVTAMKASGINLQSIITPVLVMGALLSTAMILFNDQVLPRANHRLRTLQTDIARKKPTFGLKEQVINEVSAGRLYLRTARIDASTNRMFEVVIYDLADPAHRRTIYADSGTLAMTEDRKDLSMQLYSGVMQEVSRDHDGELQRVFYQTNNIRVRGIGNSLELTGDDGYKGDREQTICELNAQTNATDADIRTAQRGLEQEMVNQVRLLSSGRNDFTADTARLTSVDRWSIAGTYCRLERLVLAPFTPKPATVKPGTKDSVTNQPPAAGDTTKKQPVPVTPPAPVSRAALATAWPSPMTQSATTPLPKRTAPPGGKPTRPPSLTPPAVAQTPAPVPAPIVPAPRALPPVTIELLASQAESQRIRMESAYQGEAGFDVEIHKKFALSVACVVFVLFGAPIALRFPRGGVGLTLGVSLFVFALYYVGLIAGESLADRGSLPPWLAMWGTDIIFAAVGLWLQHGLGREQVSGRGGGLADAYAAWRDKRAARKAARERARVSAAAGAA